MTVKFKIMATAAAAAVLVGISAAPALAADRTGTNSCGGQYYPTVQYQNTSGTETLWKNSAGTPIKDSQYAPNAQVYNQSPQHASSTYKVAYAGKFNSFRAFCG